MGLILLRVRKNLPKMSGDFLTIKSTHSLVAKHVTKERWDKVKDIETKTCGFTIAKACACAIEFDNQHCGIYAGDWDCYKDFSEIFDAIIQDYHGISPDAKHTSDMDVNKVTGNIDPAAPVHSTRIRVGRNIDGFGLSPGITKQQRIDVEKLMSSALGKLTDDLAGNYYPLTGMDEKVRQQLVDDHFLFVSGDPNLTVAGMERDWPEGRGIFHNAAKTFLLWVNEEEEMSRVSLDVLLVESRLLETQSRLSVARTLLCLNNTDSSTPAQPILELVCVPPSMLTSLAGPRSLLTSSRLAVRSWLSSPVEHVENLVARLAALMTSPTSTVLDTLRSSWSRS